MLHATTDNGHRPGGAATAYERITDALADRLSQASGTRARARCPGHDGQSADSLAITSIEGQTLLYCHAGCRTDDVLAALDLSMADLFDNPKGITYRYDNGRTVQRTPSKKFWQGNTKSSPVELYRLSKVRAAVAAGATVYVVEGEKDVAAIESIGEVATCNPMGAGKWSEVDPSPLYGGKILIVADQDEPGRRHAAEVFASLHGKADVAIRAPKVGKDAADHIAAGLSVDVLVSVEPTPASQSSLTGRVFSRDQLAQLPEPEPLIGGTIDRRTVAVVAGPPGSLKSFTLLSWGCSIATGTKWLSRPVDHPGRVLLVAAEGAYGIHHRLAAWEDKHRRVPDEALTVVAGPVNLLDHREVAELCAVADGYTFVAVDTLARCMVGGDENSARDMGQAVDSLYRIRDATGGGCVAVAHHTPQGNGDRPRGSTALLGGVDTCYMAEGGPQQMTLNRTKRKDGPTDDVLSVYLELRLKSGLLADKSAGRTNAADKLLTAFLSAFKQTGASKAELRTVAEQPPATFHRSLESLLSLGILANSGTNKRPYFELGSEYRA